MALAAIGFSKAKLRRQIMVATTSVGPGATNMVTAAGVAHANRLPVLLFVRRHLCEPNFLIRYCSKLNILENRQLQLMTVFPGCIRYWDRIVHPSSNYFVSSTSGGYYARPCRTVVQPSLVCHRTYRKLPMIILLKFFEENIWKIPRPRPDRDQIKAAITLLKTSKKPLIISGGGVRYSGAGAALAKFAKFTVFLWLKTIAGKGGRNAQSRSLCWSAWDRRKPMQLRRWQKALM